MIESKFSSQVLDALLQTMPDIVKHNMLLIFSEYERACEIHKEWPMDFIHAAAIVAEESGELVQAANQHRYEYKPFSNMKMEAVQTGAMALRFLVNAEGWWCNACNRLVSRDDVTPGKRHDEDKGGCGCDVE